VNRTQRKAAVSAARQLMTRDRLRFGSVRGTLREYIAAARALAEVSSPTVERDTTNDEALT
jgi:hypothetical protein